MYDFFPRILQTTHSNIVVLYALHIFSFFSLVVAISVCKNLFGISCMVTNSQVVTRGGSSRW